MDWPLLASLDDAERRAVLAAARRRRFARNEVVFHEGDPGDTMHLIAKGRIALRVTTPLGDIATLTILGAGDHFGEFALIAPAPRNATAVALEPVETLILRRDQLDELRSRHHHVDRFLLHGAVAEVRRLSHQLLEALYVPADKRVLRRLFDLTDLYADGDPPVVIPITQEDLAQLAGTTRPTTNRVLRQAEHTGVIRIARGRVEVCDVDALERRAR